MYGSSSRFHENLAYNTGEPHVTSVLKCFLTKLVLWSRQVILQRVREKLRKQGIFPKSPKHETSRFHQRA